MLHAINAIAFFAMTVAGMATGLRLLWAARRTHQSAELWIGVATLASGLGGFFDVFGLRLIEAGNELAFAFRVVGRGVYVVSIAALLLGVWRIFRPERVWAAGLAFGGSLAGAAVWGAYVGQADAQGSMTVTLLAQCTRLFPFVWAACESFAYHARMKRRLRLGLADPVITHQFWLWGLASSSLGVLLVIVLVSYGVFGVPPIERDLPLLLLSLSGATGACTIYTAFFPPGFYRRWIEGRAGIVERPTEA